ncbi:MAG: xanthine dehydrogenase family protein subunit M [Isosphaeraceae bacterium]
MKGFDYLAPTSLAEATAALAGASGTARVLAGGTDLIVQLREKLRDADLVVDVKRIPELMELSYDPKRGLRLGASVPCYQIYENPEIAAAYPALADATRIVGGWQIQSRASVGGNLCNASPAGDTIPALVALGAVCRVVGPAGPREIAAESFGVGPGRNALQRGELLVAIEIPPPAPRSGSAYERFIPRNEMDIAVVGVGAWVRLDPSGTTIEEARIALGAVAPTIRLAADASAWLAGQPATEATFAAAGERAQAVASPISDMRGTAEFRRHLVGVLTRRTLERAAARARG